MNKDFRLSVAFLRHPKIIKLKRRLKAEGVLGWLSILAYAAEHSPKGFIPDDMEDLELFTGYPQDIHRLVDNLIDLKLLDVEPEGFYIHDWQFHNGYAYHAPERVEQARENAKKRWSKSE